MSLHEKAVEEAICHCKGKEKFFGIQDCAHVITTDPNIVKHEFPILFELCKKGGKFRTQLRKVSRAEIFYSIDKFGTYLERKYGSNDNELLTWCQIIKRLLIPVLHRLTQDKILPFRKELLRAQQMFFITQVDKDSSAIAFVCKKIVHKLAKRFIYGPNPRESGLFERIEEPIEELIENLKTHSLQRGC